MKIDQIPAYVLAELYNAEFTNQEIEKMNPKEIFNSFTEWNGLINWGNSLFDLALKLNSSDPQGEKE